MAGPAVRGTRRRGWRWTVPLLFLVAVGVGVAVAVNVVGGKLPTPSECVTKADSEVVTLDPDQEESAATISAVGMARGLPQRAIVIALATAMQESKLYNLSNGDRDSVGLFQQRPSEGWGTAEEIMDPVYSSGQFYDALVRVPGYLSLPLTVAAQDVQHSAAPDAYASHESAATSLADALTGATPAAMSCTLASSDPAKEPLTSNGLTERANAVRTQLAAEFGEAPASDYTSDGLGFDVTPMAGSSSAATSEGWAFAEWTVAHAQQLDVDSVTYDGKTWSRERSSAGWRAASGTGTPSDAVHIQVQSGS